MKKLLVGLLALGSISAFAGEVCVNTFPENFVTELSLEKDGYLASDLYRYGIETYGNSLVEENILVEKICTNTLNQTWKYFIHYHVKSGGSTADESTILLCPASFVMNKKGFIIEKPNFGEICH